MKHDPSLLVALAHRVRGYGGRVVVVSEGPAADWLSLQADESEIDNLVVLGFQPFEDVPAVMATADVLVGVLREQAGTFSVPSKILSYMCAGRAILAAIPAQNRAARLIVESDAGLLVDPAETDQLLAAASSLCADSGLRSRLGANARTHAEMAFNVSSVADQFARVLDLSSPRDLGSGQ